MSIKFTLDKAYGWVLLSATAIGLKCYFTGYIVHMSYRKKYFTKEFMEANFGAVHKEEVGTKLPQLGYPDMGSGKYAEKLAYKDWFDLNNAMRTHQQYVEQVGIILPFMLMSGLSAPKATAGLGIAYFVGRLLYTTGYLSKSGPSGRETGAIMSSIAFMGIGVLSMFSGYRFLRYLHA